MASLDDFDRRTEQSLAFGVMVARRLGAAVLRDFTFERDRFSVDFAIIRAKARASTPVSPVASTGMAAVPPRAMLSTAAVNCTIGRVNDRAISSASAAAKSTAIRLTVSAVLRT